MNSNIELVEEFKLKREFFIVDYIREKENKSTFLKLRAEIHKANLHLHKYYTEEHLKLTKYIASLKENIYLYNITALQNFNHYLSDADIEFKAQFGDYYIQSLIITLDGNLSFTDFLKKQKK